MNNERTERKAIYARPAYPRLSEPAAPCFGIRRSDLGSARSLGPGGACDALGKRGCSAGTGAKPLGLRAVPAPVPEADGPCCTPVFSFPSGPGPSLADGGVFRISVRASLFRRHALKGLARAVVSLQFVLLASLLFSSCGGSSHSGAPGSGSSAQSEVAAAAESPKLDIPQPPALLSGDSLRMGWLAGHYWDNLDWGDERWVTDTSALEGTFTPWAQLLSQMPTPDAARLVGSLFRKGDAYPAMQLRLLDVAEYFWHHPQSPFRSEELLIPALEAVIAAPGLDSLYKLRPRSQLASAQKNRPGMRAADFSYTLGSGATGRLSDLRAEYTLLMFYNPGCPECARIEEYIPQSDVFGPLLASGRMKVLAVYPDEDITAWREHLPQMPQGWTVGHAPMDKGGTAAYDLPGIPALYLLDRNKKVLVKDRPVDVIEAWLRNDVR